MREKNIYTITQQNTRLGMPPELIEQFFNIVSKGSGGGGASRPMIKIVVAIFFYYFIIVSRNCLETAVSD